MNENNPIKSSRGRAENRHEVELFATLLELQRRNLALSQWAKENTLQQRVLEMNGEVQELLKEINHGDAKRIKDEIGDAFWDCIGAITRAEYEGLFTFEDVLGHIYTKFAERKPFLVENRVVEREEESRAWHKAKERQKKEQAELYGK